MDVDFSFKNNLLIPQSYKSSDCINKSIQSVGGSLFKDIREVYKFKNIIGGGQFGTVRYATKKAEKNHTCPTLFAIKSISKKNLEDEDLKAMIKEVDILSTLDHPNIIRFIETYNDELYFHIVMEATQGKDLFEKLLESGLLSEDKTCEIAYKILSAICYCHSNGISHRDIKAENILFSSDSIDSEVKLIDFGLSRKYKEKEKMETVLGTPYYVAPEVLKGSYDEKCDVWSVGALAYIMIIGEPPFNGKSNNLIFNKILNEEVKFTGPKLDKISSDGIDFLRKSLCKDAKQRLSSKEILDLPWFYKVRQDIHSAQNINKQQLMQLLSYPINSRFQRIVIKHIISSEINYTSYEVYRKTFKALDINHSGFLTEVELRRGYDLINIPVKDEELIEVVQRVSSSNKGITFSDFLAASMDKDQLLSNEHILSAFKYFDLDRNDIISVNDLEASLLRTGREVKNKSEILSILTEAAGKIEIGKEKFISLLSA